MERETRSNLKFDLLKTDQIKVLIWAVDHVFYVTLHLFVNYFHTKKKNHSILMIIIRITVYEIKMLNQNIQLKYSVSIFAHEYRVLSQVFFVVDLTH